MKYPKLESRQRWLGKVNAYLPPLHNLPSNILRLVLKGFDKSFGLTKTPMKSVSEYQIPSTTTANSVTARAYYPNTKTNSVLVYFHGGGCVIGDLNSHDGFCRLLAHHGKQIVIAIDYRLAPEYKFPQPVYDAIDAWNWVTQHCDLLNIEGKKMGVGGDSAGGYYAALVGLAQEQQTLPSR